MDYKVGTLVLRHSELQHSPFQMRVVLSLLGNLLRKPAVKTSIHFEELPSHNPKLTVTPLSQKLLRLSSKGRIVQMAMKIFGEMVSSLETYSPYLTYSPYFNILLIQILEIHTCPINIWRIKPLLHCLFSDEWDDSCLALL